jgi:hypothetical protein
MPTFTPTGHPDFIPTNSTPIPVPIGQELAIPAGSFGPITIDVTSGGAYAIAVAAVTPADVLMADIYVEHVDLNGNAIFTEAYGAVMVGSGASTQLELSEPTFLRGNIYGSQLVISGRVAASAFINAVLGDAGLVASEANLYFYALPNGLGDPEPKMSNGSGQLGTIGGLAPGNMLVSLVSESVADGASSLIYPLIPYSGDATLFLQQQGVSTTPTNLRLVLQGWTVTNGSASPVWEQTYATAAALIGEVFDIDLPACLVTVKVNNVDGAQTASVNMNVTGSKTA